jgi:hypothetical protein
MSAAAQYANVGPVCICCDLCRRLLLVDGSISTSAFEWEDRVACFYNWALASDAAMESGWKVDMSHCCECGNEDGPEMHICPECQR